MIGDVLVFVLIVGLVVVVGILVGMIVAGRIDRITAPGPAPRDDERAERAEQEQEQQP